MRRDVCSLLEDEEAVAQSHSRSLSPKDPRQKIIKRVIGIEGDFIKTLGYKNRYVRVPDGHLWIEGDHHGHSFDSNTFGPLDGKIVWNWFLIFLPVWTFDLILLLMLIVKMAGRCKPGFDPRNGAENLKKRVWYLVAMLLKLAFV
ncbi:transmembrane 60-like protein [Labeo rohita]|uniref:Mitochondrial inner membrane protease subunit 2 n=1 Tax=Labeo rohita TaxID=84645 RepID=A0A498MA47_LABRO|nr:transmembrane 60-like protein [Labeo rohita]